MKYLIFFNILKIIYITKVPRLKKTQMLIHFILIHVLRLPSLRRHYSRDLVPSNRCHHHLFEIMIPEIMSLFVRLWRYECTKTMQEIGLSTWQPDKKNLIKKNSIFLWTCAIIWYSVNTQKTRLKIFADFFISYISWVITGASADMQSQLPIRF